MTTPNASDRSSLTYYPAYTDKADLLADLMKIVNGYALPSELHDYVTRISNTDLSGVSNPTVTHY